MGAPPWIAAKARNASGSSCGTERLRGRADGLASGAGAVAASAAVDTVSSDGCVGALVIGAEAAEGVVEEVVFIIVLSSSFCHAATKDLARSTVSPVKTGRPSRISRRRESLAEGMRMTSLADGIDVGRSTPTRVGTLNGGTGILGDEAAAWGDSPADVLLGNLMMPALPAGALSMGSWNGVNRFKYQSRPRSGN